MVIRLLVTFVVFAFASDLLRGDNVETDKKILQGEWKIALIKMGGKNLLPKNIGECIWIRANGDIVCTDGIQNDNVRTYLGQVPIINRIDFSGDECRTEFSLFKQKIIEKSIYKINPSNNPKQIDFNSLPEEKDDARSPLRCIYLLRKDELTICWQFGKRPCGFDSSKNKKICIFIYKPQKND